MRVKKYAEKYKTLESEKIGRMCSVKKGVLRKFAKFTGKHLCQRLFCNKVAVFNNFNKKESLAQVFPVNFAKFLRTLFLENTSGRLLL